MSALRSPAPEDFASCLTQARRIAGTGAGPVEYAERGEGEPLLSVHGSAGGADQGLVMAEYQRSNGYRVIAPSRSGYLGTPLGPRHDFTAQADLMARLLDHLGIEKTAVMGASGGGPAAYILAVRYPERVSCLVQVDAICEPTPVSLVERLFSTAVGAPASIALMEHAPRVFVRIVLGNPPGVPSAVMASRARSVLDDPVRMAGVRALFRSAYSQWAARRPGYRNDVELVTRLGRLPLQEISCPTLIVHGTADTSVPPRQAEHAHMQVTGSELYWGQDGEHVGALLNERNAAQMRITEWLQAQARQPAP